MTADELELKNLAADREHQGTRYNWLAQHERLCSRAVRMGESGIRVMASSLFDRVADMRNLLIAWEHVQRRSGNTPGPDGVVCSEFSVWQRTVYLRSLRDAVIDGKYEIGETRPYRLPKRSGGYRVIHVPDVADRVVQRGIVQVVQPLLDPQFDSRSLGFRPNRNRFDALALAERLAAQGRTIWIVEDLKDAFGSVPVGRMLQLFKKYLQCLKLTELVSRSVIHQRPGLIQGGPLSPLLLNLYCHHVLDRPWRSLDSFSPPLIRYADNLLVACTSASEAVEARRRLVCLLRPAGFKLKPPSGTESNIYELGRGAEPEWLGFRVGLKDGTVTYRIPEASKDGLYDALVRVDRRAQSATPDAPVPSDAATAWLRAMAPAYHHERRDDVFTQMFAMAESLQLNLRPRQDHMKEEWRRAWRRWCRIREGKIPGTNRNRGY